jgi:Tfp pilus assembly protein PilF
VTRFLHALALAVVLSLVATAQPQPPTPPDEQKAREAFQAGKIDDALKHLQAAAKANPAMAPPKVVVSRWMLEVNKGPEARVLLEQAATEDPEHPDVLLTNAAYAMREGRITDLILSSQAALAATNSPRWDAAAKKRFQREARLALVTGYEARRDYTSARTHVAALVEAEPKNPQFLQARARLNFLLGKPDDALADLKIAFNEDPTFDPPELGMAQLWSQKADYPKADEWYQKAAAAHPGKVKVQRAYAGYLLDRGRVEEAKAPLAAAQKLDANAPETRALAGLMARYTRDYPAATKTFEELVRDYPTFAFATANLALVLADSGDATQKKRAVELAELYVRQNTRLPEAHAVHGYCLYRAGRLADAEKSLQTAAALGPLTPDAAYFLARVLTDKGAVEDAHKLLKAAADSKQASVYRKDADALLAELDKKLPKK